MNGQQELNEILSTMGAKHGIVATLLSWRGTLAFIVPMVNTTLQRKMTEALAYSPNISNSIVENKTYKTVAVVLLLATGIRLPSADSLKLHQVKKKEEFETSRRVNPNPTIPPTP